MFVYLYFYAKSTTLLSHSHSKTDQMNMSNITSEQDFKKKFNVKIETKTKKDRLVKAYKQNWVRLN